MRWLFTAALLCVLSGCADTDGPFPDLPVTITEPSSRPAKGVIILWSGDAGWSGSMQGIADALASRGYGVVGLSSLRYFWYEQAPATMAADTDQLVAHYAAHWNSDNAIVAGYSFGADTLPFAWPHLHSATREKATLVALLSPFRRTEFEISLPGMIGIIRGDHDVAAAIDALPPEKVLCLTGVEETDMACRENADYEMMTVPGGHSYNTDWKLIATVLDRAFVSRNRDVPAPSR